MALSCTRSQSPMPRPSFLCPTAKPPRPNAQALSPLPDSEGIECAACSGAFSPSQSRCSCSRPRSARVSSDTDTRLLAQPAVSATHVAFVYAGDLWSAAISTARDVRRLTTSQGEISDPAFSPDGQDHRVQRRVRRQHRCLRRAGRRRRAAAADMAPGRGPGSGLHAGRQAACCSPRRARVHQPLHAAVHGAARRRHGDRRLPIPNAARGAYSPDGRTIAYNPLAPAFLEWKGYRGGRVSTISVVRRAEPRRRESAAAGRPRQRRGPDVARRHGVFPIGSRRRVQSLRVRSALEAGHAADPATPTFPVLNAAAGGGHIVYEQAGYLHLLDPATGRGEEADVRGADRPAGDAPALRARQQVDPQRHAVALGRARRIRVPRRHRHRAGREGRRPQPDDDDRRPRAARRRGRPTARGSPTSPTRPASTSWSSLRRTARARRSNTRSTGTASTRTRSGRPTRSVCPTSTTRSPSTGSICNRASRRRSRRSRPIPPRRSCRTRGRRTRSGSPTRSATQTAGDGGVGVLDRPGQVVSDDRTVWPRSTQPVFDRGGKYLYFFGSTDAGPLLDWFSQASADMRQTRNIYLAVLRKDLPSPLAKESDEETRPEAGEPTRRRPTRRSDAGKEPGSSAAAAWRRIAPTAPKRGRLDAVPHRLRRHPVPDPRHAGAGRRPLEPAGRQRRSAVFRPRRSTTSRTLQRFDLEKRKADTVAARAWPTIVCRPTARSCCTSAKDAWFIVPTDARGEAWRRQDRDRRHRGEGRPARRVDRDLRRGVADQPRLLLRPGHARRGLEGRA